MSPDPLTALWALLQGALTPMALGAAVATLGVTYTAKVFAPHLLPKVACKHSAWVAYSTGVSVCSGAIFGTLAWLSSNSTWVVAPLVAFGTAPAWRLILTQLPRKYSDSLLTETDRKFIRDRRSDS